MSLRHRVSSLFAFKFDHLQPFKLILLQKLSTFLPFILGRPIPYYPFKERREQGVKMGKRDSLKSE